MQKTFYFVLISLMIVACHRGESDTAATTSQRTLPRIAGLPTLPMPLTSTSGTFQRLWENIKEVLEMPMPAPVTRSEASYRRWVEGLLADWLNERAQQVDDALLRQRALHEAPTTERVVAHALVGWLCKQTAEDVIGADVPVSSIERADLLREAWYERMTPLLDRAKNHFHACVEIGDGIPIEGQAWVQFCRTQEQALDPEPALRNSNQERP